MSLFVGAHVARGGECAWGTEEPRRGCRAPVTFFLSLSLPPSIVACTVRGRQEAMFTYLLITEPRSSPQGIMVFKTPN